MKSSKIFLIIPRSFLFRMRNVSDKSCRENQNTHLNNFFFRKSCLLWDNVEIYCTDRQATDVNTIRLACFACWINKAADIHLEYVTLIVSPQKERLQERAQTLSYMYIGRHVHHIFHTACYETETRTQTNSRIGAQVMARCALWHKWRWARRGNQEKPEDLRFPGM
jgi:hypothetical protein